MSIAAYLDQNAMHCALEQIRTRVLCHEMQFQREKCSLVSNSYMNVKSNTKMPRPTLVFVSHKIALLNYSCDAVAAA